MQWGGKQLVNLCNMCNIVNLSICLSYTYDYIYKTYLIAFNYKTQLVLPVSGYNNTCVLFIFFIGFIFCCHSVTGDFVVYYSP